MENAVASFFSERLACVWSRRSSKKHKCEQGGRFVPGSLLHCFGRTDWGDKGMRASDQFNMCNMLHSRHSGQHSPGIQDLRSCYVGLDVPVVPSEKARQDPIGIDLFKKAILALSRAFEQKGLWQNISSFGCNESAVGLETATIF